MKEFWTFHASAEEREICYGGLHANTPDKVFGEIPETIVYQEKHAGCRTVQRILLDG